MFSLIFGFMSLDIDILIDFLYDTYIIGDEIDEKINRELLSTVLINVFRAFISLALLMHISALIYWIFRKLCTIGIMTGRVETTGKNRKHIVQSVNEFYKL